MKNKKELNEKMKNESRVGDSMVEYMSLLGEIGVGVRYHLRVSTWMFLVILLVFFNFLFLISLFFHFAPCPTKLRLQRARGELAESSHSDILVTAQVGGKIPIWD